MSDDDIKRLLAHCKAPFNAVITTNGVRHGVSIVAVTDIGTTHPIAVLDTLARTIPINHQCHTVFGGDLITMEGPSSS